MGRIRTLAPLAAALMVGLCLGALRPSAPAQARPESTFEHLALFAEVFAIVQDRYVHDVPPETLIQSAVRGMVGDLDPHSRYMSPEEFRAMREDTRGEYVGVGMEVRRVDDHVVVGQVFEGGPAYDAGIIANDIIEAIDGETDDVNSTDAVVRQLRGIRGEPVSITIRRTHEDGDDEVITFDLIRDLIQMIAVSEELPVPGYGVVRVRSFQSNTANEVRAAIDRLQAQSDRELEGIVLDLRGNPGGLLNEAIALSDAFLNDGTIVSTNGRSHREAQAWTAGRSNTRYRGPLVVLVNGNSASASEIVAGALQDNGRAVILGTRTYGKGSVQSIIDLPDGSGLKLTVSLYYTPNGRSIQTYGITPDIVVEPGDGSADLGGRRESELARAIANPDAEVAPSFDVSHVTDRQLRAGLEQLHAFRVFASSQN